MLKIRSVKEIVRSLFDVKVVQLVEALGRDQKYGIGNVGSYGAVGVRVCDWHQNIFDLMSSFTFFIIVICFPYIYTTVRASNKALGTKSPRVNDNVMQP